MKFKDSHFQSLLNGFSVCVAGYKNTFDCTGRVLQVGKGQLMLALNIFFCTHCVCGQVEDDCTECIHIIFNINMHNNNNSNSNYGITEVATAEAAPAGVTRVKITFRGITYANYQMNTRTRRPMEEGSRRVCGLELLFQVGGESLLLGGLANPDGRMSGRVKRVHHAKHGEKMRRGGRGVERREGGTDEEPPAAHSYSFIDDYCVNYYPVCWPDAAPEGSWGTFVRKLQKECQLFLCKTSNTCTRIGERKRGGLTRGLTHRHVDLIDPMLS